MWTLGGGPTERPNCRMVALLFLGLVLSLCVASGKYGCIQDSFTRPSEARF